jgi:thiol-disulfide isomerase/thioredoxin
MKKRVMHYAKETILFIFVMTLFANLISIYKSQDLNKDKLPQIKDRLIDNSLYTTPKNRPLVIHFWATWCPTCKLEAGNIQRVSKKYDVLTIAVKSGSDLEIQKYLQENDLDFKVINDKDGFYSNMFKISAFPTTFIYDKDKKLLFSEVGYTSTFGIWLRLLWADAL